MERLRLLRVFDEVVPRLPSRPARAVDEEIAAVRRARRESGRRRHGRSVIHLVPGLLLRREN